MEGYDKNGMCYECGAKAGEHQDCSYGSKLIAEYVKIQQERTARRDS